MKNVNNKKGQNSIKKWPFFAIILLWMASYGSERSFLLIFSARERWSGKRFMKIGYSEVPKPTYPSSLWPAEWKKQAPLYCVVSLQTIENRLENSDNKFNLDLINFLFWSFGILKFAINWKCAEPSLSQQASLFLSL